MKNWNFWGFGPVAAPTAWHAVTRLQQVGAVAARA
ncbi:hypothetical protein G4B88_009517 [Cannabis sativa]|uniref:Uncharacterized protein n=1 Tax=Cannabis sativa TaxID=3483 RepID=A0A7J6FH56_CANSA|nr:hypothetical protein G4B88_009517 [Cannabis sativa]